MSRTGKITLLLEITPEDEEHDRDIDLQVVGGDSTRGSGMSDVDWVEESISAVGAEQFVADMDSADDVLEMAMSFGGRAHLVGVLTSSGRTSAFDDSYEEIFHVESIQPAPLDEEGENQLSDAVQNDAAQVEPGDQPTAWWELKHIECEDGKHLFRCSRCGAGWDVNGEDRGGMPSGQGPCIPRVDQDSPSTHDGGS